MKKVISTFLSLAVMLCSSSILVSAQEQTKENADVTSSLLEKMTLRQKVGQLFLVRPDALCFDQTQEQIDDPEEAGVKEVTDEIREALEEYPVGGVVLFGKNIESPEQLRQFNADWQTVGEIPLFLAVDEEGGRVARLANSEGFDLPKYESAFATEDAGEMGHTIGAYLKDYGFNVDFAPVADVNSNPDNPVIGTRAFSDDAQVVREKAAAMAEALQEEGILPVYKHFPGHGDTAEDSHAQLAVTHKSIEELREVEWVPYQNQTLEAVMVAHVCAPEAGVEGPASLSAAAITDWLRGELGHEGLVITDSLSMGAITSAYTPGEAAIQAIHAGVDILLMPGGLREAFDAVTEAVENGDISESRIDESVSRILAAKQKLGLFDDFEDIEMKEAVFLGVENYGAEEVNTDHKDDFNYRFLVDGKEEVYKIDNGPTDSDGGYTYPIQNSLKEGYTYEIQVKDGVATAAEELKETMNYTPLVSGTAGEKTLKNFLATALMPVGTTLYVYGGGWDWQDVGSSIQARTIGVSDDWVKFFQSQDENYTYRDADGDETKKDPANSYYPYGGYNEYYYAGLDCSGYVGWTIYNVMNTKDGQDGYVMSSSKMAKTLADLGLGEWTREFEKPVNHEDSDFLPGDIFSCNGHVWICVGTCEDGSILVLHSTAAPSRTGQPGGGPELSAIGADENCEAYKLADKYMSEYYPEWYARYPAALKDYDEYTSLEKETSGKFSWNITGEDGGLNDPDGYRNMTPEEILEDLFESSVSPTILDEE